jgi:sterol 3beta-glucosyltransferase
VAKILVQAAGSTGDVQPFAALAARLAERGHGVALAADPSFEHLAPGGGVDFTPIRADFQALMPTPERKRPSYRGEVLPLMQGMLEDSWTVAEARRPELIVAHQKTLGAPHVAEKLGIPNIQALTIPMLTPTREFPLPGMINRDLGGWLNRASYRLVRLLTGPYSGLIRTWRRDTLGLEPKGTPRAPARTLYCYSPSLVPTPADWPPDAVATGYWLREREVESVDTTIEEFVGAGDPPTYIGFGSSVGPNPDRLGAAVKGAVREAGVRAVVATGWGGIAGLESGDDILVVDTAPHEWLFPRVAAVVHHGGSGTTAAGLLAGRPTVVCPFQGDQPFWGRAVQRAGAGAEPLPAKKLTSERLASSIRTAVDDPGIGAAASRLSERIRQEDGATRASQLIEDALA